MKDDTNDPVDISTADTPGTDDKSPFQSDLTKHAEELEQTMESAMIYLKDPESPQDRVDLNTKLEALITQAVQSKIDPILHQLDKTGHYLQTANERHQSLMTEHKHLKTKFDDLKLKYNRLNQQVNFNSRALEVFEDYISPVE